MKVRTQSGYVTINKRTPYGKFLLGYIGYLGNPTGAWTGRQTLAAAWQMALQIHCNLPSMSWYDVGWLTSVNFTHKPNDKYLETLTGQILPRK